MNQTILVTWAAKTSNVDQSELAESVSDNGDARFENNAGPLFKGSWAGKTVVMTFK